MNGIELRYNHLSQISRQKAMTFFAKRAALQPHLAWMEKRFLEVLDHVATGTYKKYSQDFTKENIKPIDFSDPQSTKFVEFFSNFSQKLHHLEDLGLKALRNGELMVIDLVAGMAMGFGRIAKGAVAAQHDPRYDTKTKITYLDIKLSGYLKLQQKCERILPIVEMISDETQNAIVENLKSFAQAKGKELVLLRDGVSGADIKKAWEQNKENWRDCLFILFTRQPSTLYIGENFSEVGGEYMKGHGDFFDVIQSQLKDAFEVLGIKYLFSSNIDNTAAEVSPAVLGHAIERFTNEKIEAIVELVEKYEGDKGGVPALIKGRLRILEKAFVPPELMQDFVGMKRFPYFNTNTFWWKAPSLLNREFDLPLMGISNFEKDDFGGKWRKIETIMGHGLDHLSFKALVVDRGERFQPAKYLTDLWISRTNSMIWHEGRLLPAMEAGSYVKKPLVEVSKKTFRDVEMFEQAIHGHGNYDKMKELQSLIIGGAGDNFNEAGHFIAKCGVRYMGDVAILFEQEERKDGGTLIIEGSKPSDTITIRDSLLFVKAGKTLMINNNTEFVNPSVSEEMLRKVLSVPVSLGRWPESQVDRIIKKFFGPEADLPGIVDLKSFLTEQKIESLTQTARENAMALLETFIPTGMLEYRVTRFVDDIHLKVINESRVGSGVAYPSDAAKKHVHASAQKTYYLKHGDRIMVYTCKNGKMHCVLIPMAANKAVLITGQFREIEKQLKLKLFPGKIKFMSGLAEEVGIEDGALKSAFAEMSIEEILESNSRKLFDIISQRLTGGTTTNSGTES